MSKLSEVISIVRGEKQQGDITSLRNFINENFPDVVKALRNVDRENSLPKRRKGFNLIKIESKKHGFLYYARFSHKGKILPTKFNMHTNNLALAEQFAMNNKTRLVERYLARKDGRMYKILEEFYVNEQNLCENIRREYENMIHNRFIPFLMREKIVSFDQITRKTLVKYQDCLQAEGMKAQTVNNNMKPVKKILAAMERKGLINEKPNIEGLKVHEKDQKERGCYNLEKVQGVFDEQWENEESFILCLLIYTTGMRNSEIKRLCLKDIQTIDGCRFINVKKAKRLTASALSPCMILYMRN